MGVLQGKTGSLKQHKQLDYRLNKSETSATMVAQYTAKFLIERINWISPFSAFQHRNKIN